MYPESGPNFAIESQQVHQVSASLTLKSDLRCDGLGWKDALSTALTAATDCFCRCASDLFSLCSPPIAMASDSTIAQHCVGLT